MRLVKTGINLSLKDRIGMLQARLGRYMAAEDAILSAQSYTVDGMMLTRADLPRVQEIIEKLERELLRLENRAQGIGRSRMRVVIPADGMRFRP